MELENDCEWEPTLVDVLYPDVSIIELKTEPEKEKEPEKELEKEPEKEDSSVPVPALEIEPEKEKSPVASEYKCPGRPRRKPKKSLKPHTQDMILEGVYWTDSGPELIKDGCLLVGLTSDVIDLD